MHAYRFLSLMLGLAMVSPMANSGTPSRIWQAGTGPALPFRYIEPIRISQENPQIAQAGTYATEAIFQQLYPSIEQSTPRGLADAANIKGANVSKTSDSALFTPRVNLSPSYGQEYAYINTYSNIRKYEDIFTFPSIRMNSPLPWFGGGFGGGYHGLQFGFGPNLFRF